MMTLEWHQGMWWIILEEITNMIKTLKTDGKIK
jgi:hypothetical protein